MKAVCTSVPSLLGKEKAYGKHGAAVIKATTKKTGLNERKFTLASTRSASTQGF